MGLWTGDEVLIWGGYGSGQSALGDGAAFDPSTCRWRELSPSPLTPRRPVAAVWTGSEAIFWGATSRSADVVDGAIYDPDTDEWNPISDAPVAINTGDGVWTGQEMIVFGSRLDNNNASDTPTAIGAAYDPASDRWRRLPPVELSPQASAIAWAQDQMIAWDYELTSSTYVPQKDRWVDTPDVPLQFSECFPANALSEEYLLAYFCGAAALLDLGSHKWQEIQAPLLFSRPVAAGPVFLFAGAAHETIRNRLAAYNPRT